MVKSVKPTATKSSIATMKPIGKPLGPYVSGKIIKTAEGTWGYSAGQIGVNPTTMELVGKSPVAQAKRALTNLRMLAKANGVTLDGHTVKATVFLTDMSHFGPCNEVYSKFFKNSPPARSCIAAASLPKGALYEIEATFFKP